MILLRRQKKIKLRKGDRPVSLTKNIQEIFEKNESWPRVRSIVKQCDKAGYFTVIDGGAVRDALLGCVPKDFDLASSARPQELLKLFPKAQHIGKSFGVIRIPLSRGKAVEIASFRKEGPYFDGRRPSKVEFTTIEQDAKRRDFTINSLYYDIAKKEILDFTGGLNDLKNKVIQTVGLPEKRFQEDKLRILRAVRFSAVYDLKIEEKTFQAVKNFTPDIHQISKERVAGELDKTFHHGCFFKAVELLNEINLFETLWPNWPWPDREVQSFYQKPPWLEMPPACKRAWRVLVFFPVILKKLKTHSMRDLEPLLKASLQQLKTSSKNIKTTLGFYSFYQCIFNKKNRLGQNLRTLAEDSGRMFFELALLLLSFMEKKTLNPLENPFFDPAVAAGQKKELLALNTAYQKKLINDQLPPPYLRGEDCLKAGIPSGPKIAQLFNDFYNDQLEGKIKSKEEALKALKKKV